MSRRDMIIVAVLINAGLLIVLFASALKSNSAQDEIATTKVATTPPTISELPIRKEMAVQPVRGDEVDQMLQNNIKAQPAPIVAEVAKPNFADELRAITLPETPLATPIMPAAEPVVVAAAPALAPEVIEVTVKKGDFLDKIAKAHHTTANEIMKLNGMTSDRLRIGQVLKVSNKGSAPKKATTEAVAVGEKFYVVKNGDNPWTIAVKNHMKVDELLKLNQLNEEKARKLKPGDKLRIK